MLKKKTSFLPAWLTFALAAAVLVVSGFVTLVAYFTAEAYLERPLNPLNGSEVSQSESESELALPPAVITEIAGLPPEEQTAAAATSIAYDATITEADRINILVMGIDRRPGEPFISRTDTMMVLSVNPKLEKAAILSVPRDLYADIPGWNRDRINTAFVKGASNDGPQGGAELAMETVSYNLGVHLDYYVLIDFSAFIQAVDAVGGIDVDVPVTIYDPNFPDMNYGYDPLYILAGLQHFDGLTALKYARTRHQDNDFGRAERQQQVVLAIRDKILTLGADDLIIKLPLMYKQFEEGVRTDMSLGQIVSLASVASSLPSENIKTAVLDYQYLLPYTTPGGANVLVMQNNLVAPLVEDLFFDRES